MLEVAILLQDVHGVTLIVDIQLTVGSNKERFLRDMEAEISQWLIQDPRVHDHTTSD